MNLLLSDNNYVYVPGFINPGRAKLLAKNFENFCNENNVDGDSQIPTSSAHYNYIDFLELLCNSTPEVGEFIGENVLPTYAYSRVYHKGSELFSHTDRDACEISLTIHLDGDKEWPICIKNPKGESVCLNLKSGDAMLYLGCEAEHWREKYEGEKYVQVFLHYVRSRGERAFAFFDKKRFKNDVEHQESKPLTLKQNQVEEEKDILEYRVNLKNKTLDVSNRIKYDFSSTTNLGSFINVFEDIIPHDLCDQILKEYSDDLEYTHARVDQGQIATSVRNVRQILISDSNTISKNPEVRRSLDDMFYKCMGVAIGKYNDLHKLVNIMEDSGYQLLKYDVGNFYIEHTDSYKHSPRAVSCSIALNEDYEGGDFSFFDRELQFKLKKGSVIMFPSTFMYPHEILPVTKGTRYSIVTWFL